MLPEILTKHYHFLIIAKKKAKVRQRTRIVGGTPQESSKTQMVRWWQRMG